MGGREGEKRGLEDEEGKMPLQCIFSPSGAVLVLRTPFLSRRRGFERADSEYTDKLQHYTSGHSTYCGPPPALGVRSLFGLCSCSLIPCSMWGALRPPSQAGVCMGRQEDLCLLAHPPVPYDLDPCPAVQTGCCCVPSMQRTSVHALRIPVTSSTHPCSCWHCTLSCYVDS